MTTERSRWIIAASAAAVVMAALILLFRLPTPATVVSPPVAIKPTVQVVVPAATDIALQQETTLRDPRPLFLPTEFNATLPEPKLEAGRTFLDDETLKLEFNELELSIAADLPPVATLNGKPLVGPAGQKATALDAAFADGPGPALGFGRQPLSISPLDRRGGFVEAIASATGHRVLADALPAEARPAGDKFWEPMELLATVNSAGLTTPLVVTSSSRVEEVDAHFRNYLARTFRIGDRLPPGF